MIFTYLDKERMERIKWNWINQHRVEYSDAEWLVNKMYVLVHGEQYQWIRNIDTDQLLPYNESDGPIPGGWRLDECS